MNTINLNRVPEFYHRYIQKVTESTIQEALKSQQKELNNLLAAIPEERWMHRYAENKWTIKELILHVIDAERIFSYRALCFARGEKASLPGFDENEYVVASNANARTKESLLQELKTVQESTLSLFESFNDMQLEAAGIANGNPIYVKGIGFIIAGHARHHMAILQERYL